MMNDVFKSLQGYKPEYQEIFRVVAGSHLYGTSLPTSDVDYRGVFMVDQRSHFFHEVEQVTDKKSDTVFYELHRFVDLLINCNPNIIELVFAPDDKCELVAPQMKALRDNRSMFISQRAYHSFSGYAFAQIKKAKGQNKMYHLAQKFGEQVEPPHLIDYCYYINPKTGKPKPVSGNVDIEKCSCAKVEHTSDWYRLYQIPGGVIKEEQIACRSISIDEECSFCTLMFVNYDAFEQDKRGHAQYWEWYQNRNVERWKDQLKGDIEYDCKNMAHCIRLLMSCQSILRTGEPRVVFDGADRDMLMDIRNGKKQYDDILKQAEALMAQIDEDVKTTKIPYSIDRAVVNNMLFSTYQGYWQDTAIRKAVEAMNR